jgi:hypothetical protein
MDQKYQNNIGIIHLSDMHFSIEFSHTKKRVDSLFSSIKDDFHGCRVIFIVVSGDIANTGSNKEYEKASSFFDKLTDDLQEQYDSSKIRYVFVPGNHDCDFKKHTQVRQNIIENINYDTLGNDQSVLEEGACIQDSFWNFYKKYEAPPDQNIFYSIQETINQKKVVFHCFNTAWMSQINEQPGQLFFPVKNLFGLMQHAEFDLNVAVFHHPISWLNPNTHENNRKEFQDILDTTSSLQLVGHEHVSEARRSSNLDTHNSETICLTGKIFQDNSKPEVSGFQTLKINLDDNSCQRICYTWENYLYKIHDQKIFSIKNKPRRTIEINDDFIATINSINLPLSLGKKDITLSDLFVYPHLEDMNPKSKEKIEDYIDSAKLTDLGVEGVYVLEGEGQVGKSSLLNMMMIKIFENGYYPVKLVGPKVSHGNIDKLIMEALESQYSENINIYDLFRQLPKNQKVILFDDFHACKLKEETRGRLIEELKKLFGFVFLTVDAVHGMLPQCQSLFNSAKHFSIKPFGYSKRNLLIEKYIRNKHLDSIDTQELFEKVRDTFDKLHHVLGNKLIPPYPIFLLTIIQSLNYSPLNTNETSYGYCYQTLIHLALSNAGVSQDHIDSYTNFITELAFEIFKRGSSSISERDFELFYDMYRTKFWAHRFDEMCARLLNSKILVIDYGEYRFGYIYILYFLAAKKIAEMIDKEDGRTTVRSLFEELHVERNANILVFITHHTKNYQFIEESILTAMVPFDEISPITLDKECHYYQLLNDIVEEILNDVIEMRDPAQERKKQLFEQDEFERGGKRDHFNHEEFENDIRVRPFIHAIRSIEIVGQIVKNRKGSLETTTLKEMIKELYYTGFRMISAFGELIKMGKDDLTVRIDEKVTDSDTSSEIENKIYRFLQIMSLHACLGIFTKLIHHVGVKELRDLFLEIADDIGTPAAHVVSFSINSYYGKVNMKELEMLAKEFRDNFVVLQILRSRMKAYVYNNYVDYKLKQRIGSCLKMDVPARLGHKNRGI